MQTFSTNFHEFMQTVVSVCLYKEKTPDPTRIWNLVGQLLQRNKSIDDMKRQVKGKRRSMHACTKETEQPVRLKQQGYSRPGCYKTVQPTKLQEPAQLHEAPQGWPQANAIVYTPLMYSITNHGSFCKHSLQALPSPLHKSSYSKSTATPLDQWCTFSLFTASNMMQN